MITISYTVNGGTELANADPILIDIPVDTPASELSHDTQPIAVETAATANPYSANSTAGGGGSGYTSWTTVGTIPFPINYWDSHSTVKAHYVPFVDPRPVAEQSTSPEVPRLTPLYEHREFYETTRNSVRSFLRDFNTIFADNVPDIRVRTAILRTMELLSLTCLNLMDDRDALEMALRGVTDPQEFMNIVQEMLGIGEENLYYDFEEDDLNNL